MGIRERHEELLDKVRKGIPMSKDEMKEAERLGNLLVDIDRQVAPSRKRLIEDLMRTESEIQLTHIFRTPVIRNGKKVTLADNTANVALLESLLNPGEEVTFDWFNAHYNEPAFDRLSWSDWLSPTQRKVEAEKTAQANRQRALQLCRDHNLSECQSNLDILMTHDGDVIVIPDGAYLFNDNEELQLVQASEAELEKYSQEKRDQHQNYLRELSAKGDIAGLKAAAVAERMEKSQNTQTLYRDYRLIKGFVERQEYLLDGPLPDRWNGRQLDANFIRQSTREVLTPIIRKFGGARVDARLFGLDESFFSDWANKLRQLEYQLTGVKGSAH